MSDRQDRRSDEDDGRTVADMSGVDGPTSLLGGILGLRGNLRKRNAEVNTDDERKVVLTRTERGWYILGALGAAMLIFLAFAIGLGLIVLLMYLLW